MRFKNLVWNENINKKLQINESLEGTLLFTGWGNKQDSQKSRQQESATILQSLALQ